MAEDEDTWTVALYGASGALGREVRIALEGEALPVDHLVAVAGSRSAGTAIPWRGRSIALVSPPEVDASQVDIAVLACPDAVADEVRRPLLDAGALVVDLTGSDTELPVVWPGFHPEALESHPGAFRVACAPAATLAPFVAALAPFDPPARVSATLLLGASATGRVGEEALTRQTLALLNHQLPDPGVFDAVLAFNALAGAATEDGGYPVEERASAELRALLPAEIAEVPVHLTAAQVPLFGGPGITVTVEWDGEAPGTTRVAEALNERDDLLLAPGRTAVRDAAELDEVLVGRLRVSEGGVLTCFLAADGVHRTAGAVGRLLDRVLREDLW